MNKFDVFIELQSEAWKAEMPDFEQTVLMCRDVTISSVLADVLFLQKNKNFNINLALSNDMCIQSLNKQFRNKDVPTNVLSFANLDSDDFEQIFLLEDDIELGDVIISLETLKKQALDLGISFKEHFCHLWIHGLLHILGYDHIEETDRLKMEAKEIEILKQLGFANPYQE